MKMIDLPPVWMLGALVLIWILNRFLPVFDFGQYLGAWIPAILMIVGLLYIILATLKFRAHHTPIHPGKEPSTLITTGIFKISRNPIYTGYALIILAFVIQQGDIIGAPVLGLFVWVITKRFILPEEAVILAQFPEAKDWFDATNRW